MLHLIVRHIVYILRYREKGTAMILSAISIAARFDREGGLSEERNVSENLKNG